LTFAQLLLKDIVRTCHFVFILKYGSKVTGMKLIFRLK